MSVPALQLLRAHFPQARITLIARSWVADLYRREPFCDELISYPWHGGLHQTGAKWRLAMELRRRRFDCAILLQNAFEAAALVRAAGIGVRIGYAREVRSFLLTSAIAVPRAGETPHHQRFYYLELLKRAGLIEAYSVTEPVRLSDASAAAEAGRRRFQSAGFSQAVIGVSPGAAYGGAKRWLPERFAESAVALAHERQAAVAVFGSGREVSIGEAVREQVEARGVRCLNFAGVTALGEFIDLAAACELFLTNDSGPMHIASALNVPTVAVFGATDHLATGPTGLLSRVVREPVDCSPCLLPECPIDHRCMTRVTAAQVSSAASELLQLGTQK